MTGPAIPAPQRDLKNVDPKIPETSSDVGPVTSAVFAMITVVLGAVILLMAAVAAIFEVSPLPRSVFSADDLVACLLAAGSGVGFIATAHGIRRRSLLLTAVFFIAALASGYLAVQVA